jgi:hypothetical protein
MFTHLTYIYHKSFGGDGLCVFVRINADKFEDSFNGLADYYHKNYNGIVYRNKRYLTEKHKDYYAAKQG